MLKIKDMNLNNVIRQGDSQPREYQLDTGNLDLNLTNKSAVIRLMTADFQGIGYETTATVSSENKISFSIDDVIPARQYRLEVTVDDYVFPSRATDGQFSIDPSSHGQEVNIINVIGKEEIVRDVKAQVENELEPFLGEIEQAELDRQAQEEARVEAESTRETNEQTRLNKDLLRDNKIAQMEADKDAVIANATVDSEVILARGGKATLGQRLDETTAQLAHKAGVGRVDSYKSEPQSLTLSGGGGDLKPFVSFVDDDGHSACYDTLYPLFESKGIVATAAVTVSHIGSESKFMTKDNLLELQDNGWEIASHNYDEVYFNSGNLTIEEIDYQARKSKEVLSDWGLAVNNYVYTGGQTGKQGQSETFRIIKKHYRSAYNTTPGQNKLIDNYHWMNRVGVDSGTLSSLKVEVDKCLAENNWLVFMVHSGTHNAERTQIISDLIDYIKSKNIGIGTLNDGLDIFGSSFNIGFKEKIMVRSDGEIHGTGIGSVFRNPNDGYDIDENTPLHRFEENKVTHSFIRSSNNIEMPSPVNDGVLTTYNLGLFGAYASYQTWVQYNREAVYKRRWNGTLTVGEWGEWQADTFSVITPRIEFGPHETKVLDIDISKAGGGLTNQTPIVATCRNVAIDNFSYNIRIASPTTAKLRITNLTDNPSGNQLVLYASDWDIKVFRR